jgi:hypothetical protein
MRHRNNPIISAAAIAAAALALSAGQAVAQPDVPTRVSHAADQARHAALAQDQRTPDAQDAAGQQPQDLRTPDATDAGTTKQDVPVVAEQTAPIPTGSLAGTTEANLGTKATSPAKADDDVNWSAVGIGAGIAAAIGLAGLGAALLMRRSRVSTVR